MSNKCGENETDGGEGRHGLLRFDHWILEVSDGGSSTLGGRISGHISD